MALGDQETVLSANEAFYDAFAAADMNAMESIWAQEADISCLHPGWPRLTGRDEVLNSWRGILENPNRPRIECTDATVSIYGDVAVVLCYEQLDNGHLLATNIFVREEGAWRMAHHHAGGPVNPPE
ncbi:MAG: nuclear transport factor 2 family protein [Alphaproteobacteria bacterium]